jgi:hypothetical protein
MNFSTPPPLPETNPYSAPASDQTSHVPQTSSEHQELVSLVMEGTRFITIPYAFSIIILSFRRSMGSVHQVDSVNWPISQVILAAVITTLFGWWGIPFGVIWSILSLFYLWSGGRDSTREILTSAIGPMEAKRVLSIARKPTLPPSIWLVRAIILIPIIAFLALLFSLFGEI